MPTKNHVGANHRNGKAVHPKFVKVAQVRSDDRPHWDRRNRTLFLGDRVVKHMGRTAPVVELIRQALEEQGWSFRIDDPLPGSRGRDAKRRLHMTVQNLNRSLGCGFFIFRGDGSGKGICWEAAVSTATHSSAALDTADGLRTMSPGYHL